MPGPSTKAFTISHLDGLGQGVSKETDKITFIPKTLPGEKGFAQILAQKKGVHFATLTELTHPSDQRIEASCPHFAACPSCHFLHTSYDNELQFKQQSLERLFKKLDHPPLKVTGAVKRDHYRNRLQLHYDLRSRKLGMLDAKNHRIIPVPHCQIARPSLERQMQQLYHQESWIKLVEKEASPTGHIELYELNDVVKIQVNRPYAWGGFTQVFSEMNDILKQHLSHWSYERESFELVDLFAGNGNLSEKMNYSRRLCVDFLPGQGAECFFSQNLYAPGAIGAVRKKLAQMALNPTLLILDPPRSGLKNLDLWLQEFSPSKFVYVSCDPHTLIRDISPLKKYQITQLELVDFFPGTFHFETMAFLERK